MVPVVAEAMPRSNNVSGKGCEVTLNLSVLFPITCLRNASWIKAP